MAASFAAIPTLSYAQSQDPATKPAFLQHLRDALLRVGFFYLADLPISPDLTAAVIAQTKAFFALPDAPKLAIEMKNANSFLGYSRLGNETTAHHQDWREQLDLSTPHALPAPTDPAWLNLRAPNQWPDPSLLPLFRPTFESYIAQMSTISTAFTRLIAEAIGLAPTAFDHHFDPDQQHKLKLVKYPDHTPSKQGVGPHKDSMLSSYLLQVPPHRGLQAQNQAGDWVDCPPRPGTVVVAIGQGMEAITGGVCTSTTHRVVSPAAGQGARYSVPFFQGVGANARFEDMHVPESVRALKRSVVGGDDQKRQTGAENTFVKGRWRCLGEATLMNRIKSHPDVGEAWYPDLLEQARRPLPA